MLFLSSSQVPGRKWINDSYYYWDNIRKTSESSEAGVTELSGYIFSSTNPEIVRNHYIEKLVPTYRPATERELTLCPGTWKYGSFLTTLLIESRLYMPWCLDRFKNIAGNVLNKHIDSFNDIAGHYDIVVNCTGLGSKYLCNDHKLTPLRGQVLKVKAPWIKTFFYADYDTYIIPGFETVTLGGCRQYDSYNLNINKYDGLDIEERCNALLPSLKGSKLVSQLVGLRPYRDPVRVEKEVILVNTNKVKVVHNYGHGGYGVTTAPGTALYAVKLVTELLSGNSKL